MILEELKKTLNNCTECKLHETRKHVVFADGSTSAKIVLIGEAPGEKEDEMGIPFVGRAGKLLDEFLIKAGIDRKQDLYIINTVKCRPPKNRKPEKSELESCRKNMLAQINEIKPKVIILCGMCAVESFINDKKYQMSKIRGTVFEYENNIKLVPIFHPSYLLRKHSLNENEPRHLTLIDLKMVKKLSLEL